MTNRAGWWAKLVGLTFFAAASPLTSAQVLTVQIAGTITNFTDVASTMAFKSVFPVGTNLSFVATFAYDPAVPDSFGQSHTGSYVGVGFPIYANGAVFNATLSVAGLTFQSGFSTGGTAAITVYNDSPNFGPFGVDGFGFTYSSSGPAQNGFNLNNLSFQLVATDTMIFGSDLLANVSSGTWGLSDFPVNPNLGRQVNFTFSEGYVTGSVGAISVSAVPESSTYAALLGAAALAAGVCRRRMRAARMGAEEET